MSMRTTKLGTASLGYCGGLPPFGHDPFFYVLESTAAFHLGNLWLLDAPRFCLQGAASRGQSLLEDTQWRAPKLLANHQACTISSFAVAYPYHFLCPGRIAHCASYGTGTDQGGDERRASYMSSEVFRVKVWGCVVPCLHADTHRTGVKSHSLRILFLGSELLSNPLASLSCYRAQRRLASTLT